MRNRETKEFLVLREELNNPDFKPVEFDGFRKETQCGEMIKCIYPLDSGEASGYIWADGHE